MRTEQEIREKIKELKSDSFPGVPDTDYYVGSMSMLKWVLDQD